MKRRKKSKQQEIFTAGRTIALLSAILLGVSAFLPWGQSPHVTVNGMVGDGLITISIGILALLLLFIRKIPIIISLFLGLMGIMIGVVDFAAMYDTTKQIDGHVGAGLYFTVIGGIGIVLGTVVEMAEEKRKKLNLFYLDDDPLATK